MFLLYTLRYDLNIKSHFGEVFSYHITVNHYIRLYKSHWCSALFAYIGRFWHSIFVTVSIDLPAVVTWLHFMSLLYTLRYDLNIKSHFGKVLSYHTTVNLHILLYRSHWYSALFAYIGRFWHSILGTVSIDLFLQTLMYIYSFCVLRLGQRYGCVTKQYVQYNNILFIDICDLHESDA